MKETKYKKELVEFDVEKAYKTEEVMEMLKKQPKRKFVESVDVAVKLGIDPKKSDQNVRGALTLPNSLGKKITVVAFVEGDKAEEAKKAGADIIGSDDLIEKYKDGNIDFDVAVTTPALMKTVSKLAKVLGPKGLMPNPKLGSVTNDVKKAVTDAKSGQVEIRNDKDGNIGVSIGNKSFADDKLIKNFNAVIDALEKEKSNNPIKGDLIKQAFLTSTMGVSYKIKLDKNI